MKIGVIGLGMVGEAVAFGLQWVGHTVVGYDRNPDKNQSPASELAATEMIFVCVPTPPSGPDGSCDISAIESVISNLKRDRYWGLVVIKSTVTPGTTERLAKYSGLRLAFCPEFLRERARFSDFVDNHELCVAGVFSEPDALLIRKAHGDLPKHFVQMTPTEAELAKYFVNCFNAQRVVFANAFYDVCKTLGADYGVIKDAVCHRSGIRPDYLTCNEQTREFGGACLPKDTKAFASFVYSLGLRTGVFEHIVTENDRVKRGAITVDDVIEERVA